MMKETKCKKPWAIHPEHGECEAHLGFMHTCMVNGVRKAWFDSEPHDGTKKNA